MTAVEDIAAHVNVFAGCLYELNDVIEIRCCKAGQAGQAFFTTPPELESLIPELRKQNAFGWGIYAGVNPRKQPGDGSKAADCDGTKCGKCGKCVKLARCIFADFDQTTHEEARAKLATTTLPAPSLMVNSGHGIHCYWRLTEPIRELETFTSFQIDLAALLGSDPVVKDPPRIMRLPGFENTKEAERVFSHIIEVPE